MASFKSRRRMVRGRRILRGAGYLAYRGKRAARAGYNVFKYERAKQRRTPRGRRSQKKEDNTILMVLGGLAAYFLLKKK